MSQYATQADLANLGLPAAALSTPVTGPIQDQFLIKASGIVDSYLRSRYTVPLPGSTYPSEIVDAVVAIAAYRLLVWRGFNPDEYDANFKARSDFYLGNEERGTKGWLDKLASGAVSIDVAADATPATREGRPRVVSRGSRGWYESDGSTDDSV